MGFLAHIKRGLFHLIMVIGFISFTRYYATNQK